MVILEDETNKLLEHLDLNEIAEENRLPCHPVGILQVSETEERRLDLWRILLIDFLHHLSLSILDVRLLEKSTAQEIEITRCIDTLRQLDQMSDHERTLLIRCKNNLYNDVRQIKNDYTVFFGNIVLDLNCLQSIIKRGGTKLLYLERRLSNAFKIFSNYQIRTLYIEIPKESHDEIERMRVSLRVLSSFQQALATNLPVTYLRMGNEIPLSVIYDENNQPNPNLTILASLNNLKPEILNNFVNKVNVCLCRPEFTALGRQFTSIYSALFGIQKIRNKLKRSPIEINNVQWSLIEKVYDVISSEKAQLARFIVEKVGESVEEAARIMESVYGNDFGRINVTTLAQRLLLTSKLLSHMEDEWEYPSIKDEVLGNIKKRLSVVKDDVIDELIIDHGEIKVLKVDEIQIQGKLHDNLNTILLFYKGRSHTKQKIKRMVKHPVNFNNQDYDNIAEEFNISIKDAQSHVELLRTCFNENGQFFRAAFEKNIPAFVKYEKSIFSFLWHFLNEILNRKDRLAFLNAFQHLIDKSKHPQKALLTLLEDFCGKPLNVKFSDRNAMMLCSLLVRTYNKDIYIDIELTPEEVLMVWDGVNKPVALSVSKWIETEQKRFLKKIRTIHRMILNIMDEDIPDKELKPLNFLVALEREILIFLSLVGGETSFSVIRSTVKEYGDPDSKIYRLGKSQELMPSLLSLLQIAIRALSRAAKTEDIKLIKAIKNREDRFCKLKTNDPRHPVAIKRVMRWADKECKNIEKICNG